MHLPFAKNKGADKPGHTDHALNVCYRKVPKFSDAEKLCCNLAKVQTKRPNLGFFHQMMQME